MVDLFCGPNLPLGKAFLYCGWRCLPVDWALDPSHDLSNPQRQDSIREQLQDAVFAAAALDCSTKSRALGPGRFRGIWVMASPAPARCGVTATPRAFQTCPWQISFASPKDNLACSFVLTELQALADRVGAAFGKTRCVVSIGS